MSGPYCPTCKHFMQAMLSKIVEGECLDPTKIITVVGNPMTEPPFVGVRHRCTNWTAPEQFRKVGE